MSHGRHPQIHTRNTQSQTWNEGSSLLFIKYKVVVEASNFLKNLIDTEGHSLNFEIKNPNRILSKPLSAKVRLKKIKRSFR
jgi:Ulp1 family protease